MGGDVDTAVVDASMGWVAQHCTIVGPAAYGGNVSSTTHLYDCRGAA